MKPDWAYIFGWLRPLLTVQWWLNLAENLGKLAILFAICQWLFERGERIETRHTQAWSLIMIARGAAADAGRSKALEMLNRDGVDLSGVPLSGAYLSGLVLYKGFSINADFSNSNLDDVNFIGSALWLANFRGARLRGVGFRETQLYGADFREARFPDTGFFNETILTGANFKGVTINLESGHFCETVMPDGAVNDRDCNTVDQGWLSLNRDVLPR